MAQALVKKLGRILSIEVGLGGKYNTEYGIHVSLGADMHNGQVDSAWKVDEFIGDSHIKPNPSAIILINTMFVGLLIDADATKMSELKGKPVVCIFKDGELDTWHILRTTV